MWVESIGQTYNSKICVNEWGRAIWLSRPLNAIVWALRGQAHWHFARVCVCGWNCDATVCHIISRLPSISFTMQPYWYMYSIEYVTAPYAAGGTTNREQWHFRLYSLRSALVWCALFAPLPTLLERSARVSVCDRSTFSDCVYGISRRAQSTLAASTTDGLITYLRCTMMYCL